MAYNPKSSRFELPLPSFTSALYSPTSNKRLIPGQETMTGAWSYTPRYLKNNNLRTPGFRVYIRSYLPRLERQTFPGKKP